MATLKRRKIEDGAYEIVDQTGAVVATIEEWGKRGYRWRVIPTDKTMRGWDTETITSAVRYLTQRLSEKDG